MPNLVKIEHGARKGICIGEGFRGVGSRITTSSNRCVLFNLLLNKFHFNIEGKNCADFCCGSGIVGFELLSCGAKSCIFIDCDKKKLSNVEEALRKFGFNGECKYVYLPQFFGEYKFDLIFFDPPYENAFAQDVINMVAKNNLLTESGMLIFETKNDTYDYSLFDVLHIKDLKNDAKFVFLRKKQ